VDLDNYPAEAGLWHETRDEHYQQQGPEFGCRQVVAPLMHLISTALTARQREATLLYFLCDKTQEEIAEIMGISRRVVSQHIFGICRNGKRVGGAIEKLRKVCRRRGIDVGLSARPAPELAPSPYGSPAETGARIEIANWTPEGALS
jgi:predicted DNA-binding protein YlxM (UPF0122 family)